MSQSRSELSSIRLRTNAKLNLFLRVAGRRPDGYHELESVFQSVGLADTVTVTFGGSIGNDVRVELERGLRGEVPDPSANLVTKAVEILRERAGLHEGIAIEILKRIPIGAGLGGGSSNAAGVLLALKELRSLPLTSPDLAELGEEVGSDVPFCLTGGTALALDKGGDLTALPSLSEICFVLGLSFEPLGTRAVYERWDEVGASTAAGSAPMALALGAGDVVEVAKLLHNDLETAAVDIRPELARKRDLVLRAGALGAGMSGSGPTVFGIARDARHGAEIAAEVEGDFDRVVVVSSRPSGVERVDPAPG